MSDREPGSHLSAPISSEVARTVALHTQRLTAPLGAAVPPTPEAIAELVAQLGCVQIDTLQMVHRSHYLVLWSRLGAYDLADFDRLVYGDAQGEGRVLFEYWQHAASIIPLADYRYTLERVARYRNGGGWWPDWHKQPDNRALVDAVKARITEEGALRAADFQHKREERGTWWDWKPAKHALEYLYNVGDLMIRDRANFQRVYDLRERVLPEWVDTSMPAPGETDRYHLAGAARALGVFDIGDVTDYLQMKRGTGFPVIERMIEAGEFVPLEVMCQGDEVRTLYTHRDTLPLIAQVADGAIHAERTTFLSPFDSLFWTKDRIERLWGFWQALEAYKPAETRQYGYFCLPILHRDRLIGRFDPKLERGEGLLRIKALYLEPDVSLSEELIADVAAAMRDFLAWHGASDLVIERSQPDEFGARLLAAL